jgi:hypothetical protein
MLPLKHFYGGTKMMRKYITQFTEKNLTGNAGLVNLGQFAKKLGIFNILCGSIDIKRAPNANYKVADAVMMLMFGVLAGARHISHMVILSSDSVIRKLFKWDGFPDDTTFGRIFKLFSHRTCHQLCKAENVVRKKVWSKKWFGKVTLDLDSTVRNVFGNQQGAEKGYNPKKKGQRSYHPLMCFVAETRECLHNWFRSGSAFSANGCVEFMKECFEHLPKRVWKVIVRADSAFFNGALLDLLEQKGCLYMIKVKLRGLKHLLNKQKWHKIANKPGFESTVFMFKCGGWKHARRFVAVRQVTLIEDPNDLMFKLPKVECEYFCYVTNMNLSPMGSHKYYGRRATSENWIEWCKNHMAAASILTDSFWANSALFQTSILAYNLMVWMMWLNDEKGFRQEPNTIRRWLIHVPAKLQYRGRQWYLKLSKSYPFRKQWEQLEASLMKLSF